MQQSLCTIGISQTCQKEVNRMPTIRRLREDAGWTANELALAAGVSLSTVNRMESGKPENAVTRLIANKVLIALSQRLGRGPITIEDIENLHVK
jgi:transcriptional regulator with XRE-family HTH domain